jgi:hypothetical protein
LVISLFVRLFLISTKSLIHVQKAWANSGSNEKSFGQKSNTRKFSNDHFTVVKIRSNSE